MPIDNLTKRLFIAFPTTDPLAETFLPSLKKLKVSADREDIEVRWVPTQNYHLTVVFLGDTPVDKIEKLHEPIQACADQLSPFELNVSSVNAFPDEFSARTLWLGVQQKKNLPGIEESLRLALNVPPEDRPEYRKFTPHITIGKIRKTKSCKNLLSPFTRKDFGKILVDRFVLFESTRQHHMSVYTPLKEYSFR